MLCYPSAASLVFLEQENGVKRQQEGQADIGKNLVNSPPKAFIDSIAQDPENKENISGDSGMF